MNNPIHPNKFNTIYRNFIRSTKNLNSKKDLLNLYRNQFKNLNSDEVNLEELESKGKYPLHSEI